jgi:adenylate kinase family enzyme
VFALVTDREDHCTICAAMKRVCVVGTSGSGKTTVARAIAQKRGLAYIDNDALIWRAGWIPTPKPMVRAALDRVAQPDGAWTFDGNLGGDPEDVMMLARADTLVWLDLPRLQVHAQIVLRTVRRVVTREPLWHGNRESLRMALSRDSIVWWSITSFASRRRRYAAMFGDPALAHLTRIRLASRREVDAWLAAL